MAKRKSQGKLFFKIFLIAIYIALFFYLDQITMKALTVISFIIWYRLQEEAHKVLVESYVFGLVFYILVNKYIPDPSWHFAGFFIGCTIMVFYPKWRVSEVDNKEN